MGSYSCQSEKTFQSDGLNGSGGIALEGTKRETPECDQCGVELQYQKLPMWRMKISQLNIFFKPRIASTSMRPVHSCEAEMGREVLPYNLPVAQPSVTAPSLAVRRLHLPPSPAEVKMFLSGTCYSKSECAVK